MRSGLRAGTGPEGAQARHRHVQLLPFLGLFWLVGLGLLAVAINLGRRRVNFTADREELTLVKSGPFGTQRLAFRRAELASVSAGASNVQVNHRPVPELQVRLVTGKKLGFLTRDRRGFPGHTLESFSVSVDAVSGLLRLESVRKPGLRAGVRYWLGARSKAGWQWHFNDQSVVHNSAREVRHGQWASAGDYCYVGAFSVRVSTNAAPQAEEPAEAADSQ